MFIESFWLRVVVLFSVFFVIAAIDFYLNRRESTKWKEYLFVFLMGILFSVFGSVHDQLTVTISPEYYAIGKGVGFDSLRLKASFVGLKSGMYAGIVFGCLFLFLNESWNSTTLYSWLKVIAISSLISLVLGATIGYIVSLFGVNVTSGEVENTQYLIVLGWHIGLYGGAVLGLLFQALKLAFVAKFYTQKNNG